MTKPEPALGAKIFFIEQVMANLLNTIPDEVRPELFARHFSRRSVPLAPFLPANVREPIASVENKSRGILSVEEHGKVVKDSKKRREKKWAARTEADRERSRLATARSRAAAAGKGVKELEDVPEMSEE